MTSEKIGTILFNLQYVEIWDKLYFQDRVVYIHVISRIYLQQILSSTLKLSQQSNKEWHTMRHNRNLVFWVVKTIDVANIDMTCGWVRNWLMQWISMGNFCWKIYLPPLFLFFITILQNSAGSNLLCHDRFMKFRTNKYYSRSDKIHLGLGVT